MTFSLSTIFSLVCVFFHEGSKAYFLFIGQREREREREKETERERKKRDRLTAHLSRVSSIPRTKEETEAQILGEHAA
jgi:hypothetical protein